ncbi:MAG: serine hydrolase domain-containing protein [Bacteroidales bacterium]
MKNLFKIGFYTIFLFVLSACATADKEQLIGQKIEHILEETGAIGVAVAVVKDNDIVYAGTYGKRTLEKGGEISTEDLFRIASISKSFTTTALFTLIEEGKLSLDDRVSDLLGFEIKNPLFPQKEITLRMLLSHTSSLNDSQRYKTLDVVNPKTNPNWEKCYSDYEPGSQYKYCNLGFNIVGTIVERYGEMRFDNFVRERVFKPLNIYGNFNVDSLDASKFVPLYAFKSKGLKEGEEPGFKLSSAAYESRGAEIEADYRFGYSTPIFSPTGGVKISPLGLANYMIMHMNYGTDPRSGVTVISKESSQLMQKAAVGIVEGEYYGMAIRINENIIPGERMVGHTGSAYGLRSAMFFEPEKKFGFVMMTNGYKPVMDGSITILQRDIVRALYEVFIKE